LGFVKGQANKAGTTKGMRELKLSVVLYPGEDGYIIAKCPVLPGCVSQGRTREEALANIREAILGCIEVRKEMGWPITEEVTEVEVAI
jgi:predicted RNase H-like HicB family nuclease